MNPAVSEWKTNITSFFLTCPLMFFVPPAELVHKLGCKLRLYMQIKHTCVHTSERKHLLQSVTVCLWYI